MYIMRALMSRTGNTVIFMPLVDKLSLVVGWTALDPFCSRRSKEFIKRTLRLAIEPIKQIHSSNDTPLAAFAMSTNSCVFEAFFFLKRIKCCYGVPEVVIQMGLEMLTTSRKHAAHRLLGNVFKLVRYSGSKSTICDNG